MSWSSIWLLALLPSIYFVGNNTTSRASVSPTWISPQVYGLAPYSIWMPYENTNWVGAARPFLCMIGKWYLTLIQNGLFHVRHIKCTNSYIEGMQKFKKRTTRPSRPIVWNATQQRYRHLNIRKVTVYPHVGEKQSRLISQMSLRKQNLDLCNALIRGNNFISFNMLYRQKVTTLGISCSWEWDLFG